MLEGEAGSGFVSGRCLATGWPFLKRLDLAPWGKPYHALMEHGLLIGEVAARSGLSRKALRCTSRVASCHRRVVSRPATGVIQPTCWGYSRSSVKLVDSV